MEISASFLRPLLQLGALGLGILLALLGIGMWMGKKKERSPASTPLLEEPVTRVKKSNNKSKSSISSTATSGSKHHSQQKKKLQKPLKEIFDFSSSSVEADEETSPAVDSGNDDIYTLASLRQSNVSSATRLAAPVIEHQAEENDFNWSIASKKGEIQGESASKAKLARLEEECQHFKDSYSALTKLYDELKAKNEGIDREKRQLASQKILALEGELAAVKSANATLGTELSKARAAASAQVKEQNAESIKEVAHLKEQNAECMREIGHLKEKLQKANEVNSTENEILREQLAKAEQKAQSQQAALDFQLEREKVAAFQMDSLKAQLEESREQAKKNVTFEAQLKDEKARVASFEAQLKEEKSKVASIEAQLKEEKSKATSIEAQLREEKSQVASLQSKISTLESLEAQVKSLNQALASEQMEKQDLSAKFRSFEVVVAEFEATKALLLASQASLDSERMIRAQAEGEITQLRQEIGELKIGIESSSANQSIPHEIAALKSELALVYAAKEQETKKALNLEEQITALKANVQESIMTVATSALALEKANAEIAALKEAQAQKLQAADQTYKQLEQKFQEERESMLKEIELNARALTAFKKRVRENEVQLNSLKSELASSSSSLSNA